MSIMRLSRKKFYCKYASIQELETHTNLESDYLDIFHRSCNSTIEFSYKEIYYVTHFIANDGDLTTNQFESMSKIDYSRVMYWTIINTPKPAKIEIDDYKNTIIPGILMQITSNGNFAPIVFFPMILGCVSSTDQRCSPEEKYNGRCIFFVHYEFKWHERPFSDIFSQFWKGRRIAFIKVQRREHADGLLINRNYIWVS